MTEKTRTCPVCHGSMVLRLGEFQCQQCGNAMPLAAPEEPKQSSGYSSPSYGSRSGGYGEIGSSLGGAPRSSRLPPAPPPAVPHDPGAQYHSSPPPPATVAPSYATAGAYGGARDLPSSDPLELEKKIYFGIQASGAAVITIAAFIGAPIIGIICLVTYAIALAINYWVLFGPEVWSKWACAGCSGLTLISILINMFSGPGALRALPQLQGVSDHAIQSFQMVTGILQLLWSGWFVSILIRDAMRKQQGY